MHRHTLHADVMLCLPRSGIQLTPTVSTLPLRGKWEIDAAQITIDKKPDGSLWRLGSGEPVRRGPLFLFLFLFLFFLFLSEALCAHAHTAVPVPWAGTDPLLRAPTASSYAGIPWHAP